MDSATAAAGDISAADGPRHLPLRREDTGADRDDRRGFPHPEHGGGLGSPGNPRFPSEPARYRVPASGFYQEQAKGPNACASRRLSKIPRGEVTSQ